MAVDPNPQIYNAADTEIIEAINFGIGDAGSFEDDEAGTEYHIWNDKGLVLGSSKMTSVKITIRDADGLEVNPITTQHWGEIKSTTIEEGSDIGNGAGDASGETDDNMPEFQAVGKENYATLGNIPANCYRVIFIRVNIPTSAIQAGVTFSLYVTNQEPSTPIPKWTTGLHGNGVYYQAGGAFGVSIGEPASILDIEKGFALIDNLETYYGAAQQYSVAALGDGTYKLYLTSVGVISAIIEASSIPANSIELSRVVVASGEATEVTDKRNLIIKAPRIKINATSAPTEDDDITEGYSVTSQWFDVNNQRAYICFDNAVGEAVWKEITVPA